MADSCRGRRGADCWLLISVLSAVCPARSCAGQLQQESTLGEQICGSPDTTLPAAQKASTSALSSLLVPSNTMPCLQAGPAACGGACAARDWREMVPAATDVMALQAEHTHFPRYPPARDEECVILLDAACQYLLHRGSVLNRLLRVLCKQRGSEGSHAGRHGTASALRSGVQPTHAASHPAAPSCPRRNS